MRDLAAKKMGACFLLWAAALLLWEGAARSGVEGAFRLWPAAGFCLAAAALGSALCGLPGRGRLAGAVLFPLAYSYYGVQLVYAHVFGSYLTLAYAAMGGQAVTQFGGMVWAAVRACLPRLLLMAVPLAAFYLLRRRRLLPLGEAEYGRAALSLLAAGCGGLAALLLSLPLMGTGPGAPQTALVSASATIDRRAEQLGLLPAGVLDGWQTLLGGSGVRMSGGGVDLTAGGRGPRNVLDGMDLETLAEGADDPDLEALSRYFSSLQGTAKNAYTGLFEGYNLIVVCAEAFSPYLIDPERTPALYRMSTEGILFENFYNSFPNLTTNGEYGLCAGLMPDLSRMSFALSVDNYLPFCLGHVFREQAGVVPLAWHNNIGTFYDRVNTHPNMGYDFRAIGCGLDMEQGSPASDLELVEKTVDEYIGEEPFHVYYMTYSGHADYTFADNDISAQNAELVADMEGSEALLAYHACQLELEKAMACLLERLEEAGLAERTVVVLTGDHAPYGLPEEDYEQLAGEAAKEPFWQYRNAFLCWTGALAEPIVVEDYCCTEDILPTLLNLFGFEYDSRLLTGRDVLADCVHAALLKDGSFLTDELIYDGATGGITWREGAEQDEDYAAALAAAVEDQFAAAAAVLDTDYYGWAFRTLGLSSGETERERAASYADIAGRWYAESVEYLTSLGALSGGGSGDFLGEDPVTRSALTAMVSRGLALEPGEEPPPYSDLEEGAWYAEPVRAAWAAGLLPEEDTFRPDDPATGAETAALLAAVGRSAGLEGADTLAEEAVAAALEGQRDAGSDLEEDILSRGAAAWAVAELLRAVEGE